MKIDFTSIPVPKYGANADRDWTAQALECYDKQGDCDTCNAGVWYGFRFDAESKTPLSGRVTAMGAKRNRKTDCLMPFSVAQLLKRGIEIPAKLWEQYHGSLKRHPSAVAEAQPERKEWYA